jgi:hypothetical protein
MSDESAVVSHEDVQRTVVYPMWVVECEREGFICTVWEKPGTGCSYIKQCPSCGSQHVTTTKVEDAQEHARHIERANYQAQSETMQTMNHITPDEVRQVANGSDVYVGVCRVSVNSDGHYEVYGEGDHRLGTISDRSNSVQHIARELNTLIQAEQDRL